MVNTAPSTMVHGADYSQILQDVGVAVFTIDARGVVLEANSAAAELFGHACEAMLGQNVSMLMPRHVARAHDGYLRHHLDTGEQRIIGRGRKVQARHANGKLFPIHLAVGRFEHQGQVFFTGVIHDLTEADRNHALAVRLGLLIKESTYEVYVYSGDTLRLQTVNRSAADNLGYTRAELTRMALPDICPEFDAEVCARAHAALVAGDTGRIRIHSVNRRKDGSEYEVEVAVHLYRESPSPVFLAVVQDVTEQNRMREALQQPHKMEAVGQLANGVAHDFSNLMTIVEGNVELIQMQHDDTATVELLDEIRDTIRLGRGLSERLLSFSRKRDSDPQTVDLNASVLSLENFLRRALGSDISLELQLAPRLWVTCVDVSRMESALVNLVINARDAMQGQGRLLIETANRTIEGDEAAGYELLPGGYVALSVSDTGPGMAPGELQRIFEPFYTTKSSGGGSGLGLSVVQGFVRQSNGHISVDSEHGKGTRFTIYLPREPFSAVDSEVVLEPSR